MNIYLDSLTTALQLIITVDAVLLEIISLSLRVSLTALALSCIIGITLGTMLAIRPFRGRGVIISIVNAMMGLPPVVVGLIVYLHLSRSGPLGWMGLLYTPSAMIIAQIILITPIIIALTSQMIEDLHEDYRDL